MSEATSPISSGPAGPHFEGQVGASYLLSMLVGAEPRGLPGTIIDRVEFQKAGEGHPLDDVVVHAHDTSGNAATLEIQVKRGLTFAPSDEVFREVVGQIVKACNGPNFWNSHHELGIAISRSSHKIDGPYQDVLTWARQLGDSQTFFSRIERPGSANIDMRKFVETIKSHLASAGALVDNEAVWNLLRRLHILVFDFTASGSASEELAKERAVRALHPEDGLRASNLWTDLTELAIDISSSGGDRTRAQLIADLNTRSFRLAGDRQTLSARQALVEASRNTLADIGDRVVGVMLTRQERVSAVHAALDQARYVEIRGNAGVGKSAVLKHLAEQISADAAVIALSPNRTVAKGWQTLRAVLGFDGTAHDLLSDLAGSGGGVLFIDGVDFFGAEERLTVTDLIREAARVPGMSVVVTARRDFGITEPNWLPVEALDKLGRATPVVIEELNDTETEELRTAAPQLSALLSDSHPARSVVRNLFRLSRLANRPSGAPTLRTEAEMAEEWWESADGARDVSHRDRARVLKALGEQILARADHLTVTEMPASSVDALIASESLRDLGNDRVAFRHDVLREWAIANLLFSDPSLVKSFPLDRPASADHTRGVEIAARLAIERTTDVERWCSFYTALNKTAVHESWGRAVVLALVRSEIAADMLDKTSAILFADRAKMLRELIRIVMAVESEPARKFYAAVGIDPLKIPAGITVPSGPSWGRLISWLLDTGVNLPAPAILDVVSLYTHWSIVLGGKDPYTPIFVRWFYHWLSQISPVLEISSAEPPRPLGGDLTSNEIGKLAEELKTSFLLFCNHAPALAVEYLISFKKHPYRDHALRELLKFRGALAQAAPKELAEITAEYLLPDGSEEDYEDNGPFRKAFKHRDLEFVPASPAQGPFYDLLMHAPAHGLPLIRQIVDHAIAFQSGGKSFGTNALTVAFPDGTEKVFPWYQSYGWSRELGAGPSVVASALMALEAWAHQRIEKGEPVDKVVEEVIGQSPAPAAYLLVAVDLLLSHWPASQAAAIPYVACPDLLCLDLQRVTSYDVEMPDILGLKQISSEPTGSVSIESLKARPSRRSTLDQLLDRYALDEYKSGRAVLEDLLRKAVIRLGAPENQSDLGDPEFMVLHALNRIDPSNWKETIVQTANGPVAALEYVSPAAERDHLKPLQDEIAERHANARMEASIRIALNDADRSSPTFATAVIKWAQDMADKPAGNETQQWMREEAIISAALVATRDGGAELIDMHGDWIRETFRRAFRGKHDPVHRTRDGLQYNPVAIAFVGTALLLKNRFEMADVRTLLEVAGDNPAAAQGFYHVAGVLAAIDERLPRAVLRSAFAACVQPSRQWDATEEGRQTQRDARRREIKEAIEAEFAWLNGREVEPVWPSFVPTHAHHRHRISISRRPSEPEDRKGPPEKYTDHHAAALWLGKAATIFDVTKRPWLLDVAKVYSKWTMVANGAELEENDDPSGIPHEWNYVYFKLLAHCLPGLTIPQIDELAVGLITGLPGEAFLDVLTVFVRNVDAVYFNGTSLGEVEAVHIRTTLARQLMKSSQWIWQRRQLSDSITTHLGPAIAAVFFNDFGHFQPAKCYLLPPGIDRLDPFLPLLTEVAESGPFLFAATTLLNLLEVSPRQTHLGLIWTAAKSWVAAHPDRREFWIGQAVGRRVCSLLQALLALDPKSFAPDQPARREIDDVLGKLIRLGVAEAHGLEKALHHLQ